MVRFAQDYSGIVWLIFLLINQALLTMGGNPTIEKLQNKTANFKKGVCHFPMDILWKRDLHTSVLGNPVIAHFDTNSLNAEIIVAGQNYVHVLDSRGSTDPRFPFQFQEDIRIVADPLLFDLDRDGNDEIVISTFQGHTVFLKSTGSPILGYTFIAPPLPIKKAWLELPTVDLWDLAEERQLLNLFSTARTPKAIWDRDEQTPNPGDQTPNSSEKTPNSSEKTPNSSEKTPNSSEKTPNSSEKTHSNQTDQSSYQTGRKTLQTPNADLGSFFESFTDDGRKSFGIFSGGTAGRKFNSRNDPLKSFQFEKFSETMSVPEDSILLDAHIMATPVIVDSNGDGVNELIVPVTYYFDSSSPIHTPSASASSFSHKLGHYVASALVIFELTTGYSIPRVNPLELTYQEDPTTAFLYTTPAIIRNPKANQFTNLNGQKEDAEILLVTTTGTGKLFVMTPSGTPISGFPVTLPASGVVGAPVAVSLGADLVVVAQDGAGNVISFEVLKNNVVVRSQKIQQEVWKSELGGRAHAPPMIGDVDGDQKLDLVYATDDGQIVSIDIKSGKKKSIAKFDCSFYVQPLLIQTENVPGSVIAIPGSDGALYMINGNTGCFDSIGLGMGSYSMALADDISRYGTLELVIVTGGGEVFLLDTRTTFDPLKTWTAHGQGRSSHVQKSGRRGVYLDPSHKEITEYTGQSFSIGFHIVDLDPGPSPIYNITIRLGALYRTAVYTTPGLHYFDLPLPLRPQQMTLRMWMETQHGEIFQDSIVISAQAKFHRILKWFVLLPFSAMAALIITSLARLEETRQEELGTN